MLGKKIYQKLDDDSKVQKGFENRLRILSIHTIANDFI